MSTWVTGDGSGRDAFLCHITVVESGRRQLGTSWLTRTNDAIACGST